MSDHGGGHSSLNGNLIAVCVAVVAVSIAAVSIFGKDSNTRTVEGQGYVPAPRYSQPNYSRPSYYGNPNADHVPPGFTVVRE